jgi:hypothetical protein
LILTDHADFGLPHQTVKAPMVLVRPAKGSQQLSTAGEPPGDKLTASTLSIGSACGDHPSWGEAFSMEGYWLQTPVGAESQRGNVVQLVALLLQRVALLEPFERIHEAIREAQRIGSRSQETHGHAA